MPATNPDSLRPAFDQAAEAIAAACNVIPLEQPLEEFLCTAKPAAVTMWQQLEEHLAVIEQISRTAAQFDCRTA